MSTAQGKTVFGLIYGQLASELRRIPSRSCCFLPAIIEYSTTVAASVASKKAISESFDTAAEEALLHNLNEGIAAISTGVEVLTNALEVAQAKHDSQEKANACLYEVIPAMNAVRAAVDEMEAIVGHDYWPIITYNHMLFYA